MRARLSQHLFAGIGTAALAAAAPAAIPAAQAQTRDIRVQCYSDGNECPVTKDLAAAFAKANPDINVTIDEVPYSAILQSLPVQLAEYFPGLRRAHSREPRRHQVPQGREIAQAALTVRVGTGCTAGRTLGRARGSSRVVECHGVLRPVSCC